MVSCFLKKTNWPRHRIAEGRQILAGEKRKRGRCERKHTKDKMDQHPKVERGRKAAERAMMEYSLCMQTAFEEERARLQAQLEEEQVKFRNSVSKFNKLARDFEDR